MPTSVTDPSEAFPDSWVPPQFMVAVIELYSAAPNAKCAVGNASHAPPGHCIGSTASIHWASGIIPAFLKYSKPSLSSVRMSEQVKADFLSWGLIPQITRDTEEGMWPETHRDQFLLGHCMFLMYWTRSNLPGSELSKPEIMLLSPILYCFKSSLPIRFRAENLELAYMWNSNPKKRNKRGEKQPLPSDAGSFLHVLI